MKINCTVSGLPFVIQCGNVNNGICRITGKSCDVKPVDAEAICEETIKNETLKEKLDSILEKVNRGLSVSVPCCPASALPLKEAQAEPVELLEEL